MAPLEANAEMNAEFIIFNHFMEGRTRARSQAEEAAARLRSSPTGAGTCFAGGRRLSLEHDRSLLRAQAGRDARGRRADDGGAALDSCRAAVSPTPARCRASIWPRWARCRGRQRRAAGRVHAAAQLVPGQHVRARVMGARHAVRPDGTAGAPPDAQDRLSRGRARTLYPAAAFHQIPPRRAAGGCSRCATP